jgi:hypothetical protein
MASFPEWLLWAKKLRDEHEKLKGRITELETECERLRITQQETASSDTADLPVKAAFSQLPRDEETQPVVAGDGQRTCKSPTTLDIDTPEDFEEGSRHTTNSSAMSPGQCLPHDVLFGMSQADKSLNDYLEYAQQVSVAREEALVKAFLDGLTSPHQRAALTDALAPVAPQPAGPLSWSTLYTAATQLVKDMDKRRRKKRTLNV